MVWRWGWSAALYFVWPSPLLLALAAVGMFHSARAVFRAFTLALSSGEL